METNPSYRHQVAAELRAEMARQRKTIAELALVLGLADRKSAKQRYDGVKALTVEEVDASARWLGIPRADLFGPTRDAEAVAS